MSISSVYRKTSRCMLLSCSQSITKFELLDTFKRLLEEIESGNTVNGLFIDLTNVIEFFVTTSDMRDVAAATTQMSSELPGLRVVIVAPTELMFGMMRMWDGFSGNCLWQRKVLRQRVEAENWLSAQLGLSSIY